MLLNKAEWARVMMLFHLLLLISWLLCHILRSARFSWPSMTVELYLRKLWPSSAKRKKLRNVLYKQLTISQYYALLSKPAKDNMSFGTIWCPVNGTIKILSRFDEKTVSVLYFHPYSKLITTFQLQRPKQTNFELLLSIFWNMALTGCGSER